MAKDVSGTWNLETDLNTRMLEHSGCGRTCVLRKNEILYNQEDLSSRFFYVLEGLIKVSIVKPDGGEVILELMGPRSVCGEGAAFDRQPRFSGAQAIERSVVLEFDTENLRDVFRSDPDFAIALLRIVSLKQRVLAVRMEHLTYKEPEARLMELFRRLSKDLGVAGKNGRHLRPYLTHEQIAAMTGTSRVTVTRAMQRLRRNGEINIVDRRILIPELQKS